MHQCSTCTKEIDKSNSKVKRAMKTYRGLDILAFLLTFVAILQYIVSVMMLTSAIGGCIPGANSGGLGIMGFSLLLSGIFTHAFANLLEAIGDIARNSWKNK